MLRFSSYMDAQGNELIFKSDFLGRIDFQTGVPLKKVSCIYESPKEKLSNSCSGLMLETFDINLRYVPLPNLSMVRQLEPQNGRIDLTNVEADQDLLLKESFVLHNDLAYVSDSKFFQNLDLNMVNQWKGYEETKGQSLLKRWKKRLEINLTYFKKLFQGLMTTVKSGDWKGLFADESQQNDFLGLHQNIVVLSKYFKLYSIDWKDFEVKKEVDLFELMSINLSKDLKFFWGSSDPLVMTWPPISYYLGNEYYEKNKDVDTEHLVLAFPDESLEQWGHLGYKKLNVAHNLDKKLFKWCSLEKLNEELTSKDLFVICGLDSKINPFLIFKLNADDLKVVPINIKELRATMRILDEKFILRHMSTLETKVSFPFFLGDSKDRTTEEEGLISSVTINQKSGNLSGSTGHEVLWNVKMTQDQKIVKVMRFNHKKGQVNSVSRISGNIVLEQIQDGNNLLVLLLDKPLDSKEDEAEAELTINLMVINLHTGKILKSISLDTLQASNYPVFNQSLQTIESDSGYYVFFKTSETAPMKVHVVEIYRKEIQQNILDIIKNYFANVTSLPSIDYLGEESEIVILDREFRLPWNSKVMGFSSSRSNITQKCLIIKLGGTQVMALPVHFLSALRMSTKQKEAKAKHVDSGTLYYTKKDQELVFMLDHYPLYESSRISLDSTMSLTKDHFSIGPDYFTSQKTLLESTSLILFAGVDWIGVSFAPDDLFDRVSPGFKKSLLLLSLFAMVLIILAVKFYEKKKLSTRRFEEL